MTPGLGNRCRASCWAWQTRDSPCRKRASGSRRFVPVCLVSQLLADQMRTSRSWTMPTGGSRSRERRLPVPGRPAVGGRRVGGGVMGAPQVGDGPRSQATGRERILNLVCQGAGGLGGQDWDGPHLLVGRLVLGHTAHRTVWRVGPTGHYQDNISDASAG